MNFMEMSLKELLSFEKKLSKELDKRLRQMKYDEELDRLYEQLEQLSAERDRRKQESNG